SILRATSVAHSAAINELREGPRATRITGFRAGGCSSEIVVGHRWLSWNSSGSRALSFSLGRVVAASVSRPRPLNVRASQVFGRENHFIRPVSAVVIYPR